MTSVAAATANRMACMESPVVAAILTGLADHGLRPDPLVELLRCHIAERERRLLQGRAFLVRLLRDLRRLVVADVRVERGDEHERVPQQLLDALAPGLDAGRAVLVEPRGAVGQEPHALQE